MNIHCTNMSVCICPFTNTLQIRGVCGHGLSYVLIHDVCSSPCMCLFCSGVVTQVQLSIIYSFLHAKCVLRCCLLKCSLMSVDCDLKKNVIVYSHLGRCLRVWQNSLILRSFHMLCAWSSMVIIKPHYFLKFWKGKVCLVLKHGQTN